MSARKMSRREFLYVGAAAATGTVLAACQPQTVIVKETVEVEKEKVVKETVVVQKEVVKEVERVSARQAPMLQDLVKAGTLPPLEERIPMQSLVIGPGMLMPEEHLPLEIGQYGGEMRSPSSTKATFTNGMIHTLEPILDVPELEGPIYSSVVRSYTVEEDGKSFVFNMREGMKWNDGEPVTTEDVLFAHESVMLNPKITKTQEAYLKNGAKPSGTFMKLAIEDDYRFRVTFDEPYGAFPRQLTKPCHWKGYQDLIKPAHYLKQFHADFTPLAQLEPLIKAQSLAAGEWWTLFTTKDISRWDTSNAKAVGMPILGPWFMKEETSAGTLIMERNPYYWKLDTEGNQLPYLDHDNGVMASNNEMALMMVMSGEGDHTYEYAYLRDYPLYKQNEEKGGYVTTIYKMHRTMVDLQLNFTHKDPVWRQVVGDLRFRQALTLAINRKEMIDTIYLGFAAPPTDIPSEYDPKKAEALLDEMGLNKRDADGMRLGPDGKTFELPIEHSAPMPEFVSTAELLVEHFRVIGIKTTVKQIQGTLLGERTNANEEKATLGWCSHPEMWCYTCGNWPYGYMNSSARLWVTWYQTGGKEGEDPEKAGDVGKAYKQAVDLMRKTVTVPEHERAKAIEEYTKVIYDSILRIPTVGGGSYAVLVSKTLGNIPTGGYGIAGNFCGEVFFRRQ